MYVANSKLVYVKNKTFNINKISLFLFEGGGGGGGGGRVRVRVRVRGARFNYVYIYPSMGTNKVPPSYTPYLCTRHPGVETGQTGRELETTACDGLPDFLKDFQGKAKECKKMGRQNCLLYLTGKSFLRLYRKTVFNPVGYIFHEISYL